MSGLKSGSFLSVRCKLIHTQFLITWTLVLAIFLVLVPLFIEWYELIRG